MEEQLPPLPPCDVPDLGRVGWVGWSKEAMRAYGAACALQERERIRAALEASEWWRMETTGDMSEAIASAIRAKPLP